nr:LysM domain-containing protein [Alysiella crassa]UOP07072.1 LysM peptidoglycan-binding domain-containing protein [Alysiella crassa]
MNKQIITLLCAAGIAISAPAFAKGLKVKPNAPKRYVVKQGDTLWGVSGKYLYRPHQWYELVEYEPRQNPQSAFDLPRASVVFNLCEWSPCVARGQRRVGSP